MDSIERHAITRPDSLTTPVFAPQPPFSALCAFCLLCPAVYFATGLVLPLSATFPAEVMLLFLPSWFFLRAFRIPGALIAPSFGRTAFVFVATLVLSAALNGALPYWLDMFTVPPEYERHFLDLLHLGSIAGFLRDVLALALIPAASEEFFFRGVMQMGLSPRLGRWGAIGVAAFAFAAIHFNPWYFPFYFLLGIFFGVILSKTGNLWLATFAHFINNALGVVLYHYF